MNPNTGRIFEPNTFLALDNEQLERYLILMKTVVSAVDDWVLCSQTYGNRDTKLAELTMKYGEYIFDTLEVIDDWICFRGYKLCSIGDKSNILISDMDINEKIFSVKGRISLPVKINTDVFKLYFAGKETVPLRLDIAEKASNRLCINGICIPKYNFSLAMPLDGNETLVFKLISKDTATTVGFSFVKRAKLSSEIKESFFASEGFVIQSTNNSFSVKKSSSLKYEFALWKKIAKKYSKKVILYRMSLLLLKFFKNPRRESWLFADRILAAGDNADSLFSYVNHLSNPPKTYFIISPESAEYERLRKTGHVIKYGSVKHFLMLGLCDKYLSSNADDPVSILKKHQFLICDCFRYKHIYLQHGIMKDDHSDSLCRFAKGYELITVSTRPEFEMILNGAYGYNSNQIALTGLARYDDLHDESQRKDIPRVILFAPTWRVKLSMAEDIKTGKRPYNKKFIESEYYQFYYNLINDSRLIDVMKENNYIGEFHLHPAFISQSCDFPSNEVISTHLGTTYYPEVFARCSLMITDYSSVCFDFAYMKKPIVFSQFDSETFWQSHTYKQGYFDYERDGFGPVCYDYESTVQAIIDAIERGCTMEEKYKKRVDNFFEYRDDHNCERIYQEILKLDQEKVT